MKEYYLELANIKEAQLNMANVGYAKICHEIGNKLLTCTLKESYQLIKELNEASEAYKRLEDDYKSLVKKYQEEALYEVKEDKTNA